MIEMPRDANLAEDRRPDIGILTALSATLTALAVTLFVIGPIIDKWANR